MVQKDRIKCWMGARGFFWVEGGIDSEVPETAVRVRMQFFGASCHEQDMIGKFMLPYDSDFFSESGLATGERVVFSNVSTYSVAWNTSFNGIPEAEIAWWNA